MTTEIALAVAEAYRWHRRLGNIHFAASHCHIVANHAYPEVWDANHADEVTAKSEDEIDAVFAAMDVHLAHTPWRIVHTDGFTPDAFVARLALDDFEQKFVAIQMALQGDLAIRGAPVELRSVVSDSDWHELLRLVLADHAEGRRTGGLEIAQTITEKIVAGYRAKSGACDFHFAMKEGAAVAYGSYAAAPNGLGMIEHLFTLPSARRQGVATSMISAFVDRLRASGCKTIFLGALAGETAKHLYARLGFRPVGLACTWVKQLRLTTS